MKLSSRLLVGLALATFTPLACDTTGGPRPTGSPDANAPGGDGDRGGDGDGSGDGDDDPPDGDGGGAEEPMSEELPPRLLTANNEGEENYGDEGIGYRNVPGTADPALLAAGLGGGPGVRFQEVGAGRTHLREPTLVEENPFIVPEDDPTSTFSIEAGNASYVLSRQSIDSRELPEPETVRVEEFVNYFNFHYAPPAPGQALSLYTEVAPCPWNPERRLLMLGLQGEHVDFEESPPGNFVFLIDVSGSMQGELKLDLLKLGLKSLALKLREEDTLSIVTYSNNARVVLENAKGDYKNLIVDVINGLQASGSTNGAAGLEMAYELGVEYFKPEGTNRILLATDGDFNVGLSSNRALANYIAEKRSTNVDLSVFGYGMSAGGDRLSETLAHEGNGLYFRIDSAAETNRAFTHTLSGVLLTVARDVKWRVGFNSDHVKGYRLLGYEDLLLTEEEFYSEWANAGELGAGMTSTALFEIIPAASEDEIPEPLEGTLPGMGGAGGAGGVVPTWGGGGAGGAGALDEGVEFLSVQVNYRNSNDSRQLSLYRHLSPEFVREIPSLKFMFAAGIAEFAMRLRGSQYLPAYIPVELEQQLDLALPLDFEGAVVEATNFLRDTHDLLQN